MAPRLLATSDLHVNRTENEAVVEDLHPTDPGDWLIVAGDVGDRIEHLRWTMSILAERFARVIWVPGNHELWTPRDEETDAVGAGALRAPRRGLPLARGAHPRGRVAGVGGRGRSGADLPAVPALRLLVAGAPGHGRARRVARRSTSPARPAWSAPTSSSCPATRTRARRPGAPSGWRSPGRGWRPARRDADGADQPLAPDRASAAGPAPPGVLALVRLGGDRPWHLEYDAAAVVYGHLHLPRTTWEDGVRFEEVSVGYPREWQRHGLVRGPLRQSSRRPRSRTATPSPPGPSRGGRGGGDAAVVGTAAGRGRSGLRLTDDDATPAAPGRGTGGARAVASRRAEFTTARTLRTRGPAPRSERRSGQCRWGRSARRCGPTAWSGRSRTRGGSAVRPWRGARSVRSVGIDAEVHDALPHGVLEAVSTEAERSALAGLSGSAARRGVGPAAVLGEGVGLQDVVPADRALAGVRGRRAGGPRWTGRSWRACWSRARRWTGSWCRRSGVGGPWTTGSS